MTIYFPIDPQRSRVSKANEVQFILEGNLAALRVLKTMCGVAKLGMGVDAAESMILRISKYLTDNKINFPVDKGFSSWLAHKHSGCLIVFSFDASRVILSLEEIKNIVEGMEDKLRPGYCSCKRALENSDEIDRGVCDKCYVISLEGYDGECKTCISSPGHCSLHG